MTEFEQIYTEYFTDIYKFVLSMCRNEAVAEDIAQETFLKAFENINKFKGECKLNVWLCQIAKNTYFTAYRKNRASERDVRDSFPCEDFESELMDKETAYALHKALHNMEEPYKEVFSLRIFGELSFAQIGELFAKTESWARVTFHRAKIKLKEEIEE